MNVDVFIPCEIDQFAPEVGINMIRLLKQVGCIVHYHPDQTCCGRMAFELGNWKQAKKMGEKFIDTFSGNQPIVFPSLSCMLLIQQHYKILFHNTAFHNEYQQLESKIVEFTDFAYHQLHVTDFGATFPHKVLLIDDQKYNKASKKLLSTVREITLLEPQHSSSFNIGQDITSTNEAIAANIAKHAILDALDSEVEFITSINFETLRYLHHFIRQEQLNLQVIPVINILSSKS